ncbi:MAG TPA: tetratricopeptide repeat protein [Vicinamibacterales bacterium]|nr:tetratricopeptide repeat protein [Vicinamibacterales bacterium]
MTQAVRAGLIAVGAVVAVAATSPSAQAPQDMNVYAIVDAGPVPVPGSCSCISSPFTVAHAPSRGPRSGAGAPLEGSGPPINLNHLKDDRASFARRAEDGLDGNYYASFGIAMHLSLESALAGGDPRMEEEAARWLHLAAAQENADAFRFLGLRYARGRGLEQNAAAAAYWFHQGALRGDPISMTALGLRYAAGSGVTQNWNAAARWWLRAQAHTPLASRFLGDAYACGLGVDLDPVRAEAAYKAAAEKGESSSSTQLGHLYAKRCVHAPDQAALEAYERAADDGDPEAQIELSDLVRQGRGTDPNPYRAYTLARLAELRLPEGAMKARAAERVKSAVRLMLPEAIPAQEALVQSLIAASAKPVR